MKRFATISAVLLLVIAVPALAQAPSGFTYFIPLTLSGGRPDLGGTGSTALIINGSATMVAGQTFTMNGTFAGTNAPITAGSTGITFTGSNTYSGSNSFTGANTLSGNNTYSGTSTFTGDLFAKSGRPWYDVRAFGAKGDGTTDDTSAVQAAITAAIATPGTVYFPPGTYSVGTLNATSAGVYLRFLGAGPGQSVLAAKSGTTGHLIDATGSRFQIENMGVGTGSQTGTPDVALLLAHTGTGGIDQFYCNNVHFDGSYSSATIYAYGVQSSTMVHCIIFNRNTPSGDVLELTGSNRLSVTSTFTTIGTGTVNDSDWTFIGDEFHLFGNSGYYPVRLDNACPCRWVGGNLSTSTASTPDAYLGIYGPVTAILLQGTTLYSDNSVNPNFIVSLQSGQTLTGFTATQLTVGLASTPFGGIGNFTAGNQGGAPSQLFSGGGAGVPAGTTTFFTYSANTTESNIALVIPQQSIISDLHVNSSASPGTSQTYTATMRTNGVSTGITCQIGGASTACTDTSHYANIAPNTTVDIQYVTSAGASVGSPSASFVLTPVP